MINRDDSVTAHGLTDGNTGWKTKTYSTTLDIPPAILEKIGGMNTHWALAEYILGGMQYKLLSLNPKKRAPYGTEPQLQDVAETISKIGRLRGLEFPFDEWTTFIGTLTECDRIRDMYDHGVWFVHETEGLCLLQGAKESWQKEQTDPPSKRLLSGRTRVDLAKVEKDLQTIKDALARVRQFSENLGVAVQASQSK